MQTVIKPGRKNHRPSGSFFALCLCLFLCTINGRAQVTVQIGQNFVGSDNSQTYITPADANGTVGLNYYVEFINGSFAVYNKSDGSGVVRISDTQFWSNAGPGGGSTNGINFSPNDAVSDPRVIYDPASHRWFASQVRFDGAAADPTRESDYFLLGVSDTDDPGGSWHVFTFLAAPGAIRFADFPTMGVDSNAVYLSGDMYSAGTNSLGTSLTMIPKADLLANPPTINNRVFFGVASYFVRGAVLQPVTCLDGSSSGNILAAGALGDDFQTHSNLIASTVLNPGATNATWVFGSNISVQPYETPIDAAQPDGTSTLADNDARFSARVYTVGGVIYAVHNTELSGRAAIRWYRLSATNYALLESGTIADASLDLIYPSIAANPQGVVVIACNGSGPGPTEFISSYAYVGQTVNGVTTFGNSTLLAAGAVVYHDINEQLGVADDSRWGDYSTVSVDPADSNRFWTIQMIPIYDPLLDSGDLWQMQITEIITSLPAVRLSIALVGTNAIISWPSTATGFQLQSTTNLTASTVWTNTTQTLSTNGGTISVLVSASHGRQFFRLQK
jgi:hypothetical protein